MRIIALGVLNKPRGTTTLNPNAKVFLHPPGIEKDEPAAPPAGSDVASEGSGSDALRIRSGVCNLCVRTSVTGVLTRHDLF